MTEPKRTPITCVWCDGRGSVPNGTRARREAEDKLWCKCPAETQTFGSYPRDGECRVEGCYHKHHVHCGTCGKVSQIG